MTVCQEFRDSDDNLLTCFKTVIGFFDTAARKLLPWPEAILEKAENMLIDLPPHAAPKFCRLVANRMTPRARKPSGRLCPAWCNCRQ